MYVSVFIRCCVPFISGLATGMRVGQVGAFVRVDLLASVVIFWGSLLAVSRAIRSRGCDAVGLVPGLLS